MWTEMVIGEGKRGNSATRVVFNTPPGSYDVSFGGNAYWISEGPLDIGMTIFKNCQEGQILHEYVQEYAASKDLQAQQAVFQKISHFLLTVQLHNLTPELLHKKLEALKEQSFQEGQQSKVAEIRQVLGIGQSYF